MNNFLPSLKKNVEATVSIPIFYSLFVDLSDSRSAQSIRATQGVGETMVKNLQALKVWAICNAVACF